jgi:hypothetical protein
LVEGLANHFLATACLSVGENSLGVGADFFAAYVRHVGGEPAEQFLRRVRMELRFELRPANIEAAENPPFERAFFQVVFDGLGDSFEVLPGFVGDVTFGVAGIVSGEAVAATPAG